MRELGAPGPAERGNMEVLPKVKLRNLWDQEGLPKVSLRWDR